MKLTICKRLLNTKNDVKRVRRQGKIPAVMYDKGQKGENIAVDKTEFLTILRHIKPGRLATTVFELSGEGVECRVIVKDIQYDVVTYDVIHLDFLMLHDDVKISVNVPIEYVGGVDCVGVKAGGVLRQVIRAMRVSCLPKDMPSYFEADVKNLGMRQSLRLSAISIPEGVTPLVDLKEVAVTIARR